ncbi:MAG: hypothetical protein R3E79_37005 [Caldilineaceae bacterium]
MINTAIAHQRLQQQRISQSTFAKPVEVVAWLGAPGARLPIYLINFH